jgi:alanine-synthesizing transaminase
MWVLLGPGDSAIVPSPSYPIHLAGPGFAGATVITVPMHDPGTSTNDPGDDFFEGLVAAWERATVKPRVIICSFPHNPTSACVDLSFMQRLVDFALEHEIIVCHDFAYADLGFDGYKPPSILQVPRAKECCVELYTLTKSFSMAGWRVGFMVGNAEIVAALTKLKSYLDYGTFQPVQIAAIVAMNEAVDYPEQLRAIYQSRRDTLIDGLQRIGWPVNAPRGSMFIWAPIPEPYRDMHSLEFAKFLIEEADVATSPGVGFGDGGDGHVRFALIENELRTHQAVRNLRRALTKLG